MLMGKRYSFVRFWLLRDQRVLMLLSVFLLSGSLFDTANAKSCDAVIGLLENNPHLILIKNLKVNTPLSTIVAQSQLYL